MECHYVNYHGSVVYLTSSFNITHQMFGLTLGKAQKAFENTAWNVLVPHCGIASFLRYKM